MTLPAVLAAPEVPAAPTAPADTLVVPSDLLGPLTVRADQVLELPAGLFGFPACRRFVLVPGARAGLWWLQSTEHAPLVFLLADPFRFVDGYEVELPAADAAALRATSSADVAVLVVVTLPRARGGTPTANLRGPLALNLREGIGRQLALEGDDALMRVPLPGLA